MEKTHASIFVDASLKSHSNSVGSINVMEILGAQKER
jgi:hypothetical protein